MSAFVPVITTVVTTPMSTVITVAHTRRGARSIVAAASAPNEPSRRAVAAVALTMGAESAKPRAISAPSRAAIATKAKVPRNSMKSRNEHREHRDGAHPTGDPDPARHDVRGRGADRGQRFDRRNLVHLPCGHRRGDNAGDRRRRQRERDGVARQPVLDAGLQPLGHRGRQSANGEVPRQDSDARPDGSADQPENRRLRQHVADDGDAPAADRAQHRNDRPALGDRHRHRGIDQKCAHHQGDRRAEQGHVVHQLDAVAGAGRPDAGVGDDRAAVHRGGDRGADRGQVGARFRGDQYRVELTLAAGDGLRQSERREHVVAAVEIRELLALEQALR